MQNVSNHQIWDDICQNNQVHFISHSLTILFYFFLLFFLSATPIVISTGIETLNEQISFKTKWELFFCFMSCLFAFFIDCVFFKVFVWSSFCVHYEWGFWDKFDWMWDELWLNLNLMALDEFDTDFFYLIFFVKICAS